jgi:hypothetical protein
MQKMKVPKFENEADEAKWFYENREELAEAFLSHARQDEKMRGSPLETALFEALQTKELSVTPEELTGRTLVAALREKIEHGDS